MKVSFLSLSLSLSLSGPDSPRIITRAFSGFDSCGNSQRIHPEAQTVSAATKSAARSFRSQSNKIEPTLPDAVRIKILRPRSGGCETAGSQRMWCFFGIEKSIQPWSHILSTFFYPFLRPSFCILDEFRPLNLPAHRFY